MPRLIGDRVGLHEPVTPRNQSAGVVATSGATVTVSGDNYAATTATLATDMPGGTLQTWNRWWNERDAYGQSGPTQTVDALLGTA